MKNVTKGVVTTIIGIAILLVTLLAVYFKGLGWWPDGTVGVALGILLLLTPDTVLTSLKTLLNNKAKQ